MDSLFETLEFNKVLSYVSEFVLSDLAKQKCMETVLYTEKEQIQSELFLTADAKKILDEGLIFPIDAVENLQKIFENKRNFTSVGVNEIMCVTKNLNISRLVHNFLQKHSDDYVQLAALKDGLYVNIEFEKKIETTFDSALELKDCASPEIKRLRQSQRDAQNTLKTAVSKMLSDSTFTSYLQDTVYTIRDERIVFQVKADLKNKVKGIVHDVSASGQTFFIEPKELVSLNNKLRETEILIKAEKDRIISQLAAEIFGFSDEALAATDLLARIDFIFAKAKYANKTNCVMPDITDEKVIELKEMKNPVLMRVCDNIIENDFEIGCDYNVLIITGSNTGGKTVVLKTAGLCLLMARAGFFVPCESAKIYPFKKIFADIGDNQNIIQSLSTFSSHMRKIIAMVNEADEEAVMFIDEIAAGTDPKEGAALAQVILEYLQKTGCICVVTSHYSELKTLGFKKNGFENASVEFNTELLTPTYKLLTGIPGISHAIEIAHNLGLKYEIISLSKEIYYYEKDNTALVLKELQEKAFRLSQSADEMQKLKNETEELKFEYQKKLEELKKEKKRNINTYRKKYETEIDGTKQQLKEIVKQMREEKSEKVARRSYAQVNELENKIRSEFAKDEAEISDTYKPVDWAGVKIGGKFLVKDFNQPAQLISLPDKNDNVQVMMGSVKTTLKKDKLAVFDKKLAAKSIKKPNFNLAQKAFETARYDISNTLDLRGMRLEESLDALEIYLDTISLCNLTPVYIIHGHGTGVLKQAVREYLNDSPYVSKSTPAHSAQGGDGVTVVELK